MSEFIGEPDQTSVAYCRNLGQLAGDDFVYGDNGFGYIEKWTLLRRMGFSDEEVAEMNVRVAEGKQGVVSRGCVSNSVYVTDTLIDKYCPEVTAQRCGRLCIQNATESIQKSTDE